MKQTKLIYPYLFLVGGCIRAFFIFLVLLAMASAKVTVFLSNASLGEEMYFLALEDGRNANGGVIVVSPSGGEVTVHLSNGQCRVNGSVVGEWRFVYRNKTYSSFVSEEEIKYVEGIRSEGIRPEEVMPIFLLLFFVPLAALVFFLQEFMRPPVEFRKEYDGRVVRISLMSRWGDMRDVSITDRIPKRARGLSLRPAKGVLVWKKDSIKRGRKFCVSYSMETWDRIGRAEASGMQEGKEVHLFSELADRRAYRKEDGAKRLKKVR